MKRLKESISGVSTGAVEAIENRCVNCGLCVSECSFLDKYGNPGELAKQHLQQQKPLFDIAFECSLCSLCKSNCPIDLDPSEMFLEIRNEAVHKEEKDLKAYRQILNYEKRGLSERYRLSIIPEDCKIIFFPGCTLTGTRPGQTMAAFSHIRGKEPTAGIVLSCCSKPSHDLGRQSFFHDSFSILKSSLIESGVERVVTGCPNCYKVFKKYGTGLKVESIFNYLDRNGFTIEQPAISENVIIHDPCATRFDNATHSSVRRLAGSAGIHVTEAANNREKTLCCGEGGSVACVAPGFSSGWTDKGVKQADGKTIVSYCGGCVGFFGKKADAVHLIDFLFDHDNTVKGKPTVSGAPFTYLNRLRIKRHLINEYSTENKGRSGMIKKLLLAALIIMAAIGLKVYGLPEILTPEYLQKTGAEAGLLAPVIYILLYSIAPVLFLPGSPLTVVGGILFGPVMGVVYTIIGATTGAGIAFLTARYIAGDYISQKTEDSKWKDLNDKVNENGWKIVVFTRLIPLFPFNLLNYFFGLTRVKFSHYMIASFFGMLPGTIAFVVFSSSIPELIKGNLSTEFIVGLIALVTVILIPVIYKKLKKNQS